MKFCIDDANVEKIRRIYEYYPVDGVSTNPSILAKSGRDPYEVLKEIREIIGEDGELREEARQEVMALLRRQFRPEFLNRLDEVVFYKPLTRDNMRGIIDLMLNGLRKRLADKELDLTVTDNAKDLVIARGYDPMYGARPLRRYLQQSVETLLARHIIANDLAPETVLTVDEMGGKLYIR